MNISAWAIKRPIPIILMFILLTLFGWISYGQLGINDTPDVDFPIVVISVAQAGASPSELETDVTRKVEDALVGIPHLEHIRSTVTDGSSSTVCEFEVGADTQLALNDVRDAVSKIRQTLPQDITEPSVTHPTFSGEPFITYTIASKTRPVSEVSRYVDEDLTRALLTVPGVAQIRRSGGTTREIAVRLDPSRLRAVGLNVDQVNNQLRALNLNLPGGRAEAGNQEQTIRTLGSAKNVAELGAMNIALPNGLSTRLDTLGTVEDTHAEIRQKAYLGGKEVVSFSVVRSQGSPLVQTEQALRAKVEAIKKTLPADYSIEMVNTMADYTRMSFHASIDALVIGSVLAIIVIFIFLRSWQATVIAALAIPLSIIPTFGAMKLLGFSLNGITLLAVTLVVGILVDDAIVDLENIYRHIQLGKTPLQAAFEATDEIGLAIIATTSTIVCVFVPVAFMGGIVGQFFRSFGLTVAVAVLFSLLVARTLTPLLGAYWLPKKAEGHEEKQPFFQRWYLGLLSRALSHRWVTLGVAIAIFIGSLALVPAIPKGFVSRSDIGLAMVSIQLPAGARLEDTDAVVKRVAALFEGAPGVKTVFATVGQAVQTGSIVGSAGGVTSGAVNIILVGRHERALTLDQFMEKYRVELEKIPGARIAFQQFGATGSAKPVNMILTSADGPALTRTSERVLREMRGLPELRDVTSSAAELRPEVQIVPDFARAAEQGVSVATIGRLARLYTQGDVDFNLPKFNAGDQQINIRVQLDERSRSSLAAIGDLLIPGRQGLVPLRSVAEIRMGSGPVQIDRYDRARQATLSANLSPGAAMGEAITKVQHLPTMKNLPPGVAQDTVGESKVMADVFSGFAIALGTGVLLIYVVLVLLFGGFMQPLTIMMALPLAIGGALLGLLVGNKILGMYSLIGIIMLMGLVTKNSILLVEYAIMSRRQGLSRHEALMRAGRDRVRPILMTTIAMIAGMLPIALAFGEGTEALSPMAVAVIGGLITSTLLTLVIIPAVYTMIDDMQNFFHKKTGMRGLYDEDPRKAEIEAYERSHASH